MLPTNKIAKLAPCLKKQLKTEKQKIGDTEGRSTDEIQIVYRIVKNFFIVSAPRSSLKKWKNEIGSISVLMVGKVGTTENLVCWYNRIPRKTLKGLRKGWKGRVAECTKALHLKEKSMRNVPYLLLRKNWLKRIYFGGLKWILWRKIFGTHLLQMIMF